MKPYSLISDSRINPRKKIEWIVKSVIKAHQKNQHAGQIDTMVVSTQEQRIGLIDKLKEYGCGVPRVEVIPVSGPSKLRFPERERKRYSLISVSRITPQKKS